MKNMIRNTLIGAVSMLAVAGVANAATVSINPSVTNVAVGDAFMLTVGGTDFLDDATSGGVNIVWNPTQVTLTSTAQEIVDGLDLAGFGDFFNFNLDAAAGTLDTTFLAPFDIINNSFGVVAGPTFTLFTLDFVAIPPPSTSNITIGISALAGAWQDGTPAPIAVDFVGATVNVSAVPVPAAVWLFGSGLLGLVGVARPRREPLAA